MAAAPQPYRREVRIDRDELSPQEKVHAILREAMPTPAPPAARRPARRARYAFSFRFGAVEGAAVAAQLERYCREAGLSLALTERWSRRSSTLSGEATGARAALGRLGAWLEAHALAGAGTLS